MSKRHTTLHYPPCKKKVQIPSNAPSTSNRSHFLKLCASVRHVEPFTPAVAFCWQQQVPSVGFRLDQPKSVRRLKWFKASWWHVMQHRGPGKPAMLQVMSPADSSVWVQNPGIPTIIPNIKTIDDICNQNMNEIITKYSNLFGIGPIFRHKDRLSVYHIRLYKIIHDHTRSRTSCTSCTQPTFIRTLSFAPPALHFFTPKGTTRVGSFTQCSGLATPSPGGHKSSGKIHMFPGVWHFQREPPLDS
jgi:hypothetical protein